MIRAQARAFQWARFRYQYYRLVPPGANCDRSKRERLHWSPNWRYLIPIGFIGAYTTFSTFEFETFRSMESGLLLVALLNVALSVFLGFLGVWLGVITGRAIA